MARYSLPFWRRPDDFIRAATPERPFAVPGAAISTMSGGSFTGGAHAVSLTEGMEFKDYSRDVYG